MCAQLWDYCNWLFFVLGDTRPRFGSQTVLTTYREPQRSQSSFELPSNGHGEQWRKSHTSATPIPTSNESKVIRFVPSSRPSMGAQWCANCPDRVFANERVDAVGKVFHRLCFKCADCRRMLDRGTACDHKNQVFCKSKSISLIWSHLWLLCATRSNWNTKLRRWNCRAWSIPLLYSRVHHTAESLEVRIT